jgi:enamine deaminase RidA (YjgF/YER057c/UK114 family)
MDEGNEAMLHRVTTQPDPYEPFLLSQGIRFGELLFISGQAGAGDDGGSSLKNVIKVTIFVTDMGHFDDVVALRREFFGAPYPADTIAQIQALYDPAAMIEIEAIAAVHGG